MEKLLLRNQALRRQLAELTGDAGSRSSSHADPAAGVPPVRTWLAPLDIVVTFNEVNLRHGTGVLLSRIFGGCPDVVSVRTADTYDGDHSLGLESFRVPDPFLTRSGAYRLAQLWFGTATVRRVLCVPYATADVLMALALSHVHDAPLVTWIMDDQNVGVAGIPDKLMEELLERSRLRLAISPEMRRAYENKYRLKFWMLPPVVAGDIVRSTPAMPDMPAGWPTGVLVGNIWGQRWLDLLRETVRGSGVQIVWYCNSGMAPAWLQFDRDALARDGIEIQRALPEPQLASVLRRQPFAVVPSGTLDEADDNHVVARFSLPTRVPFILASSHTPIIVLGDAATAVAKFVTRSGVGVVVDYDAESFGRAVAQVSRPEAQAEMRQNAARIAESFRADDVSDWIWTSLAKGVPRDFRFEAAVPGDPAEFAYFVEGPVPAEVWRDLRPVYRALERFRGKGYRPDFVVDVGASTGVWADAVSRLFPDTRFLLVEPLFSRYDARSRQYYVDGRDHFEVFEVALSDRSGRASLQVSRNLYGSSLIAGPDADHETAEVEVTTLDDLIERSQVTGRGVVKIDVQNAEHLVIAGATRALADRIDVVIVELTLNRAPAGAKTFLEIASLMDQLGFDYVDDAGEWRSPQDGTLMEKDIVFARRGFLP